MTQDWPAYFKASLDKPLHPLWEQIDPYLAAGQTALDLGCGVGVGTAHLIEKGLRVIAVDQEAEALEITGGRLPAGADVHFVQASFQELGADEKSVDVIVAFFSLFFLSPLDFGRFWEKLTSALRPGGLFAGQLLGVHDDWANRGYTVFTASECYAVLDAFDILYFEEVDRDGETTLREPKHWHVFHVVARKRPPRL